MNWSLLQNGIGIDLEGGTFRAVHVRRQWNRLRVVDRLEIPQYPQAGPQQCGNLYREFLRKHGLKVPRTVVALPRSAVLLRALSFPPAVEKELAQAVEYRLESLHPFEEGSVYWDFCLWKSPEKRRWSGLAASRKESSAERLDVLVAISEKKSVEEIASWFQEAGIPVSQFGVTATLLIAMCGPSLAAESAPSAALGTSGASSCFLLNVGTERCELLGWAPGKEPVWREIPIAGGAAGPPGDFAAAIEQELALARSALRVEPGDSPPLMVYGSNAAWVQASRSAPSDRQECLSYSEDFRFRVVPAEELFPASTSDAEGFDLPGNLVGFAAAWAAANATTLLPLNLLPPERRTYQSPLVHVPAYALASLAVLLAIGLGLRGTVQDWLYSRYLEREIQALRPPVQAFQVAQEKNQKALERLGLLVEARHSATLPLEILNELTRLLPPEVWLQMLVYEGDSLTLSGSAGSASGLLQTLAASPYFDSPQFKSAISRSPEGKEIFLIGVRLRARR